MRSHAALIIVVCIASGILLAGCDVELPEQQGSEEEEDAEDAVAEPGPAEDQPDVAPAPSSDKSGMWLAASTRSAWMGAAAWLGRGYRQPPEAEPAEPTTVTLGIDRLLSDEIQLVEGKKLGLITNASGVDGNLVPTADRLSTDSRVELVQLYAPEHGLRGVAKAGRKLGDAVDLKTGIPIESLFGKRREPSQASLKPLDALVFDIQDVGSRTYTYITTLGRGMQAAKKAGIPFIVLDRPNPQGGLVFEGPIRDDAHKSFIGWAPLPVSHGMTVGELARFYNKEMGIGCELHVVKMEGWSREMIWEDTGLHWVPTSPNIPHALNAHVYIATGMVAGASKDVNESAGYTMPFETLGAEWIDGSTFALAMNDANLAGVVFRAHAWEPRSGRFDGKEIHGIQLIPTDLHEFRPLQTALTALVTIERLYPGRYQPRSDAAFARIWGNDAVLTMVSAGKSVSDITASWEEELEAFGELREKYLLY